MWFYEKYIFFDKFLPVCNRDDGEESVNVVFLNFQKAFNKMPLQRLGLKISVYGVGKMC